MSLVKHTHSNHSHHESELRTVRAQVALAERQRQEQTQRTARIRAITTAGQPTQPAQTLTHDPYRLQDGIPVLTRLHRVNTLADLPTPQDGIAHGHMALQAQQLSQSHNHEHEQYQDHDHEQHHQAGPTTALATAALIVMLIAAVMGAAYTIAPLLHLLPQLLGR